jgi:hypothetical protein
MESVDSLIINFDKLWKKLSQQTANSVSDPLKAIVNLSLGIAKKIKKLSDEAKDFTNDSIPYVKDLLNEISSVCGKIRHFASNLSVGMVTGRSLVPFADKIVEQAEVISNVVSVTLAATEFTADVLVGCCDKFQSGLSKIFDFVSTLAEEAIDYLKGKAEEKDKKKEEISAKSLAK